MPLFRLEVAGDGHDGELVVRHLVQEVPIGVVRLVEGSRPRVENPADLEIAGRSEAQPARGHRPKSERDELESPRDPQQPGRVIGSEDDFPVYDPAAGNGRKTLKPGTRAVESVHRQACSSSGCLVGERLGPGERPRPFRSTSPSSATVPSPRLPIPGLLGEAP